MPKSSSLTRLTRLVVVFALVANVLLVASVSSPFADNFGDTAQAQASVCPNGSTALTDFNWSAAPGGTDDPATDGATWPADTTTKTWLDVGNSGLDVTVDLIDPSGRNINTSNMGVAGPGAVGTVDNIPTSTNEGTVINDGYYGSGALTWAIFSETSDEPVTLRFTFSKDVFFASGFSVDDLDSVGLGVTAPIPASSFQDEIDIIASDANGPVPVTLVALGNAVTVGQSATANYEIGVDNNVGPDDAAGQVTITTPRPFSSLSIVYSNGPDDRTAELADAGNPGTWDGVNNGQAVRFGGFEICEPNESSVDLVKTLYQGHDSGAGCASSTASITTVENADVTWCFSATNTGTTHLSDVVFDDAAVGLTNASLNLQSGTLPLAPGESATWYYEDAAPATDLTNTATITANPTFSNGNDMSFQSEVTASDTALLDVAGTSVSLTKSVYVGHSSGADCPGDPAISAPTGSQVTYCFTATNTGQVPLVNVTIDDTTLGSPTITSTTGAFSGMLAPSESVTYWHETSSVGDFTNIATVTADPANPDGSVIPGADEVSAADSADTSSLESGVRLDKTISADGTCPGVEAITASIGSAISYCFEVTNTGDTHLADAVITDADIPGFVAADLVPVSGSLALIAPGASAIARYDMVASTDLQPNTASVAAAPADSSGARYGVADAVDSDIASLDVVAPGINLTKTAVVAGQGCAGDDGVPLVVGPGASVQYCFEVTNTGDTALDSITIDDPLLGITALAVADLAAGASATVTGPTVAAADLVNSATVEATAIDSAGDPVSGDPDVSDTDTAEVDVITPGVSLDKTVVAGTDPANCPGSESLLGGPGIGVTYCFTVTNTGETHLDLSSLVLSDPALGITEAALTTVALPADPLAPGQAAIYAYSTLLNGDLLNTASVTVSPVSSTGAAVPGTSDVSDSDTASVEEVDPAITIAKTVYVGHDGGASCGGVNAVVTDIGDPITYCFEVTNSGTDAHLADLTIDDPTLGATLPGALQVLSGDPALVGPGETVVAYIETAATGDVVNTASTSATPVEADGTPIPVVDNPIASDDATVDTVTAGIDIQKTIYRGHDTGVSCDAAESATGVADDAVTWCFTVTNTGDTHLSGVSIDDPALGITLTSPNLLAPGASVTLHHESTITSSVNNTATVNATPATEGGAPLVHVSAPTDADTASSVLIDPSIALTKTVYNGADGGLGCATATADAVALTGTDATWCFTVTNTGDVHLSGVVVSDPDLGLVGLDTLTVPGLLAPGATTTVFHTAPVASGTLANVATASGNPATPAGADIPGITNPEDADSAVLLGVAPGIDLDKTVSLDGSCPGIEEHAAEEGTALYYCFTVTNTGDTDLVDISIDDDIYGVLDASNTLAVNGALSQIAPGGSATVRFDTTTPGVDQTNRATATGQPADTLGTDLELAAVTSAVDIADIVVARPGIVLIKTVVPADATCAGTNGTTLQVQSGTDVIYCFAVTNTGNVHLDDVIVEDAALGLVGVQALEVPGSLEPGASTMLTSNPVAAADLVNVATASGVPSSAAGDPLPGVSAPSDSDDAVVAVLQPAIRLAKTVVPGSDSALCPGSELVTGDQGVAVTWCFEVTNAGDAPLTSVIVEDPDLGLTGGAALAVPGPLAPGVSVMVSWSGSLPGDQVNTATTSGTPTATDGSPLAGASTVSASDTAEVAATTPSFTLSKTVYLGHDGGNGCPGVDVVTSTVNTAVTYCFLVSNTSLSTTLTDVAISDPDLGSVTAVATGDPALVPPGGSVMFYAETSMTADLVNTARASAISADPSGQALPGSTQILSQPDSAEVNVVNPSVRVAKTTYAGHNSGATCPGGETATGEVGAAVTFCFVVTNTGDTHLVDVLVEDALLGLTGASGLVVPGVLAPGASSSVFFESTMSGDAINTATVSAAPADSGGSPFTGVGSVTDSDTASVDVVAPSVHIAKTTYVGHDDGAACPGGELAVGEAGAAVTFCFVVTNTGDTSLVDVVVEDPQLGLTGAAALEVLGVLAPGASASVHFESTLTADMVNTASTSAIPATAGGTPIDSVGSVSDADTAEVNVVDPAIRLAKTASTNGTCPGAESITIDEGQAISWCFEVTNIGDVPLASIELDDVTLGVDQTDMTLVLGSVTPLAVGAKATYRYDDAPTLDVLNTATVTAVASDDSATPWPMVAPVSDTDGAQVDVVRPAIELAKTATLDGSCVGSETVTIASGASVLWCFNVTNTGDTWLDDVVVTDAHLSGSPVLTSGSLPLAPGASMLFEASQDESLSLTNQASVTADPSDDQGDALGLAPVGDLDTAAVLVVAPAVTLAKTVTVSGSCPGVETLEGGEGIALTYCFSITNSGTADLDMSSISFVDPALGIDESDLDPIGSLPAVLAPGASFGWSYSSASLPSGGLLNTASVELDALDPAGDPLLGPGGLPVPAVTDTDTAEVIEVATGIALLKTVYAGHDAGAQCDGVNALVVDQGADITWCFTVSNTNASVHLGDITIDDPALGASGLVVPGPLAPGESATVHIEDVATTDLVNVATVNATAVDAAGDPVPVSEDPVATDTASIDTVEPAVELQKTVYAGDDAGAGCPGSELAIGDAGDSLVWCFQVTNTGDTHLVNLVIADAAAGLGTGDELVIAGPIAPGARATVWQAGIVDGDLVNTASVTATPADSAGSPLVGVGSPTDTDDAEVDEVAPAVALAKTGYFGHDGGAGCDGAEMTTVTSGDPITWCFTVTNTGDTSLNGVTFDDPQAGIAAGTTLSDIVQGSLALAPGESISYYVESVVNSDTTNIATVTAVPSSDAGFPLSTNVDAVTATDSASADVVGPAVQVVKTVSFDGNCPGIDAGYADAGDEITWCFAATNVGDTYLTNVVVEDADLGITDADMVLESGAAPLAPGSTIVWSYRDALADTLVNIATVQADPSTSTGDVLVDLDPVTDFGAASVTVPNADVDLAKTVSADGTCPGTENVEVAAGAGLTWCLLVTNTGATTLAGIGLTDAALGLDPSNQALLVTPDPALLILAPGEDQLFTVQDIAVNDLQNVAMVSAVPAATSGETLVGSAGAVTATDDASVDVVAPAVAVAKTASMDGICPGVEQAEAGNGYDFTWCVEVTNTGETPLDDLLVTDALLDIDAEALVPVAVEDDDDALPLAPGGVAYFELADVVDGDALNTVEVSATPTTTAGDPLPGPDDDPSGPVTASDTARVVEVEAAISITKMVATGDGDDGGCGGTSDVVAETGAAITWCFVVTNTSTDVTLADVTVDDPAMGIVGSAGLTLLSGSPALLGPGERIVYVVADVAVTDIASPATATGQPLTADGDPDLSLPRPEWTDSAGVDVVSPSITILKTATLGDCPGSAELLSLTDVEGTWCFTVTNTGDTALIGVTVTDPALNFSAAVPGTLAPSQSVTLSTSATLVVDVVNTAAVEASPAYPDGAPMPEISTVSATDTATVDIVAPDLEVTKTLYAGHDDGQSCQTDSAVSELTLDHGSDFTWCFVVTNTGDVALGAIALDDPALGITNLEMTNLSGAAELEPGASSVWMFEDEVAGTLENVLTATARTVDRDGVPTADVPAVTSTGTATINQTEFDLVLTKELAAHDADAFTADWLFKVVNDGPGVAPGPIVLQDMLPPELEYLGVDFGGEPDWDCDITGQLVRCEYPGDLIVGGSHQLVLKTTIRPSGFGTTIINDAEVSAGTDVFGRAETRLVNNVDLAEVNVIVPTVREIPDTPTGALAFTGLSNMKGMLSIASIFLVIGAWLLLAAKRREEREEEMVG